MKRFLLDDIRTLPDIDTLCRTPQDAYNVLDNEYFDVYIFDHDLGEVHPGTTGYDVLRWALEQNKIEDSASIFLITNNPVGRDNMIAMLKSHGWWNKGQEYVKR